MEIRSLTKQAFLLQNIRILHPPMPNAVTVRTEAFDISKLCDVPRRHLRNSCISVMDLYTGFALSIAEYGDRIHSTFFAVQLAM